MGHPQKSVYPLNASLPVVFMATSFLFPGDNDFSSDGIIQSDQERKNSDFTGVWVLKWPSLCHCHMVTFSLGLRVGSVFLHCYPCFCRVPLMEISSTEVLLHLKSIFCSRL